MASDAGKPSARSGRWTRSAPGAGAEPLAVAAKPDAPSLEAPRRAIARLRRRGLEAGWRAQPRWGEAWAKRSLDWSLCLILGAPAALIVLLAAVAIRMETRGPALFSQARVGRGGSSFRMWKLRTMVVNAAALEPGLLDRNELPWPDFKITRDPRVTRLGAWLRRTSLDELPQIWNVVRNEMSFVGPRPTPFGLERYRLWHTERLEVAPGITGLWQVRARAACNFDERVRLDLAYVRSYSLGLDLALLGATIGAVLSGRGAK